MSSKSSQVSSSIRSREISISRPRLSALFEPASRRRSRASRLAGASGRSISRLDDELGIGSQLQHRARRAAARRGRPGCPPRPGPAPLGPPRRVGGELRLCRRAGAARRLHRDEADRPRRQPARCRRRSNQMVIASTGHPRGAADRPSSSSGGAGGAGGRRRSGAGPPGHGAGQFGRPPPTTALHPDHHQARHRGDDQDHHHGQETGTMIEPFDSRSLRATVPICPGGTSYVARLSFCRDFASDVGQLQADSAFGCVTTPQLVD